MTVTDSKQLLISFLVVINTMNEKSLNDDDPIRDINPI